MLPKATLALSWNRLLKYQGQVRVDFGAPISNWNSDNLVRILGIENKLCRTLF